MLSVNPANASIKMLKVLLQIVQMQVPIMGAPLTHPTDRLIANEITEGTIPTMEGQICIVTIVVITTTQKRYVIGFMVFPMISPGISRGTIIFQAHLLQGLNNLMNGHWYLHHPSLRSNPTKSLLCFLQVASIVKPT